MSFECEKCGAQLQSEDDHRAIPCGPGSEIMNFWDFLKDLTDHIEIGIRRRHSNEKVCM